MQNKPLNEVVTRQRDLDTLQKHVKEFVYDLEKCPLVRGRLIDATKVAGVTLGIDHKLNRIPLGWIIVYADSPVLLYEAREPDDLGIYLDSLNIPPFDAGNFTLWVF